MDKTAEEFRKAHADRQNLINQWEVTIEQMQRRDNEMDMAAGVSSVKNHHILNIIKAPVKIAFDPARVILNSESCAIQKMHPTLTILFAQNRSAQH